MRTCGDDGHCLVSPPGNHVLPHSIDDPRQLRLTGSGGLPPGLAGWRRVESPVPRHGGTRVVLITAISPGNDEMSDP